MHDAGLRYAAQFFMVEDVLKIVVVILLRDYCHDSVLHLAPAATSTGLVTSGLG